MSYLPIVSVLLPFYQDDATLQAAIDTILGQTFPHFELLLVANNASVECTKIARQAQTADTRVRLLEEKRQGPAFASQKAFQEARGEYIVRMDADDLSESSRLEKQCHFLERNPAVDVVACQVALFAEHNRPLSGFQHFIAWNNQLLTNEQIRLNRFVEIPIINPTLCFRKTVAEKLGLYDDGDFPEDYDMQLRWLDAGVQFAKLPEVLHHWRDQEKRLTRTDPRYRQDAFYRLKAKYLVKHLQQQHEQRPIGIWGAGRVSRNRATFLEETGIPISFYVDIIPQKTSVKPCLYYQELPPPHKAFIISYVSNRNAREKIRAFLLERGFQEGQDFLMAA